VISIIIPTLNEEEGIAKVLCSIPEKIKKQSEIIVVDASTDCTPIIAKRLGARVIKLKEKGKGRQMREGVRNSQGETLIFLDGDGEEPPEYIPKLLKKLEEADLVLGCRNLENFKEDDRTTREIYYFYNLYMKPLFRLIGLKISGDPLSGFRAIRRKDWDRLDLRSNEFEIETEMNIRAMEEGFTIQEVSIPHLKRAGGRGGSKLMANPRMWFRIFRTILRYFHKSQLKPKVKDIERRLKKRLKFRR